MELLTEALFYMIQPTWLSAWLDFIELDFYFVLYHLRQVGYCSFAHP